MKNPIVIILLCLSFNGVFAQAGMTIYGGATMAASKNTTLTKNGEAHYGNVIGLRARLNSDYMYFLLGGEYNRINTKSTKAPNFFTGQDYNVFKGRIGLGFDIVKLSSKTVLTSKIVGSINYLVSNDEAELDSSLKKTNDGFAGLASGLGLRIGALDIELEYEHGIFNVINKVKDTKLNYFTLSAGFSF